MLFFIFKIIFLILDIGILIYFTPIVLKEKKKKNGNYNYFIVVWLLVFSSLLKNIVYFLK